MNNFIESDETIVAAAPYDLASGDFALVGAIYGVAVAAALSGADVVLKRYGKFELPKVTGAAWAFGDRLYWDNSAKKFTKTKSSNIAIGVAAAAAQSADTTGIVLLTGQSGDFRIQAGQITTASAADTVVTGLAAVIAAVANLEDAPVIGCDRAQGVIGDQAGAPAAGSIIVRTYKPTATGDATPIAATTFGRKVNWIAIGI
jgi:predicted RecA/RadA family phage recombinase